MIQIQQVERGEYDVVLNERDKVTMDLCHKQSSNVWRGRINGKTACVFGICPPTILSDSAYLWLYTTPVVDEHKFIFIRHSQLCLEQLLKVYPVIRGSVRVGEDRSVRWLKWLNATFGEPFGKMIPFVIRRK